MQAGARCPAIEVACWSYFPNQLAPTPFYGELSVNDQNPVVIDLFCGAGGLSLGAARAGFRVLGGIDSDIHALGAHTKNFPESFHMFGDISKLTGSAVKSLFKPPPGSVLGVIGGPPCQGFSNIGKRNQNDPRNDLFVDFFRLVREIEPAFFLAENVPGILGANCSSVVERATSLVRDKFRVLDPIMVSADAFGAPTTRTRVFFIGYIPDHTGELTQTSFRPPKMAEVVRVKEALEGLPLFVDPSWQKEPDGWRVSMSHGVGYFSCRLHRHVPKGVGDPVALRRLETECKASGTLGTRHSPSVSKRYASLKPGERDRISKTRRLELEGFCPTLRAGTGPDRGSYQAVRPIHPVVGRVITPREAARLQGFPDWFIFSPSKWHSFRQIGSSVSPIVAERLMGAIRQAAGF